MSDEQREPASAAQPAAAARKPRPQRGAMESLLRIIHGLEVAGIAFGALAAWGVSRDWPQPLAFGVVGVLLVATMSPQRHAWGWIVSLVMQLAVAALAFVEPVWGIVALVFIILWIYCFVKARGIERRRRAAGLDPRGAPGAP
ncbi:DUF4233 domain-containing protein [Agrococcus sp. ARC_14]|uniref:DUF4233 domain-containing protein n=1 Tax=Agrococcus sp. ARC_14 TaxID=2919927 RepID=UPI001F05B747|nr:DUF4233 domain-containing protein [Agrococcus sp. ARC_14]MCH1883403.1 DUF4233 domain-containing protein [Agrococcus sp. ARC_14]